MHRLRADWGKRVDPARKEIRMPKSWSSKRERQYEHIKRSAKGRGRSARVAKRIAAAMRFATRALRPRPFADRLIFSYCLSRLLLQDFGIRISFRAGSTRFPQSARNLCIRLLGRKGEEQEKQRQQL